MCQINSRTQAQATFWSWFQYLAIPAQPYLWFMMLIDYVGIWKKYQQLIRIILLYHPIAYILIFFTNPFHHKYISRAHFISNGYFTVLVTEKEFLFWVMVISGTFLCIMQLIICIYAFLRTSRQHRHGFVTMAVALVPPWFAVYFTFSNSNTLKLDYLPVASVITAFLYVIGIFYYRMFQIIPIAYEKVFRKTKEGILLIDLTDRIIEANDTITALYPELLNPSGKQTLTEFLDTHPEFNGFKPESDVFLYELAENETLSYYSVQTINIDSENGQRMGKIFSISDVTLFMEKQRRLEDTAYKALDKAETNEISFLQAQIKPHFLNNTLSVISSMITRDPEQAKDLIADLGEFLSNRCYFDSSMDYVPLEDELENVKTYVKIEKARFGERINFQIICDYAPEVLLPRLVLQPLVENAIRHGIMKRADGGKICLTIELIDEKILFTISDDGVGMAMNKITDFDMDIVQQHGVGLLNIQKRLLKYYGEGLRIKSTLGAGTEISFSIPATGMNAI
jgi:two-component system LytT family sensor kinase